MRNTVHTIVVGVLGIIILTILLNAFGAFEPFSAEKQYWKAYKFCTERVSYQIKQNWEAPMEGDQEVHQMIEVCNKIQKP